MYVLFVTIVWFLEPFAMTWIKCILYALYLNVRFCNFVAAKSKSIVGYGEKVLSNFVYINILLNLSFFNHTKEMTSCESKVYYIWDSNLIKECDRLPAVPGRVIIIYLQKHITYIIYKLTSFLHPATCVTVLWENIY